jgi:hypothetical protein
MYKSISQSLLSLSLVTGVSAQCIGGKWDTSYIRPKDCTDYDQFDGQFTPRANSGKVVNGTVTLKAGSVSHTLSWRLSFWKSPYTTAVKDSLPLILGLHWWQDTDDVNTILNSESGLMQYEPAYEDVLVLTVALENANDLGTWWWGSKVDGVPTAWAEDGIIAMLKDRLKDACTLLANAGNTALAGKAVDQNRVYLKGHSMGGTGTYRMGIKHPEIFAAIHAHAGFADFKGNPCGNENFCLSFATTMVGSDSEKLMTKGLDGKSYPARDYTDMSWFVGTHKGASVTATGKKFEPPYVNMTHGKLDNDVNMSSANRLQAVFKTGHNGYSFLRTSAGHSEANFIRFGWMSGFRKNQSFLAFNNNSTDQITTSSYDEVNTLEDLGWKPSTIKETANHYEVEMYGTGTVDITPRRLQAFVVQPGKNYKYWLGSATGAGTVVQADSDGLLTLPKVKIAGSAKLIIESVDQVGVLASAAKELGRIDVTARGNDIELEVAARSGTFRSPARMELWSHDGRLVASSDSLIPGASGALRWRLEKPRPGVYQLTVRSADVKYVSTVTVGL